MATFFVIIQNLDNGEKKLVESSELKCFPKGVRKTKKLYTKFSPEKASDFKKRCFYGWPSSGFMHKVWILAMCGE